MTSSISSVAYGCFRRTAVCAAPARRAVSRPPPVKGSGPRTRLNFLQQVVKKALLMPDTHSVLKWTEDAPSLPVASSSVGATRKASAKRTREGTPIPEGAFTPYPTLPAGAKKQPQGSTILYKDEACVLVNDAYPKSSVHCLVMPTDLSLLSLNDLERKHVALVEHFVNVADAYVNFLKRSAPQLYARRRFITGFHALPSLPMLHLHLLTLDLDSPCLKTKKHYNSFATFFFLTSDRVLADLKQHGYITLNQDVTRLVAMEEQSMKCQWCGTPLANMPELKNHLSTCESNQSLTSP